jgi:hypothetical protein
MLARCILGDTQKRKFAHLNMIYQPIHFYGAIEKELGADGAGFNKNGNWRKKLDPDGPVVAAVTAHMNSVIRQIRGRCFQVYTGKARKWRDMVPARRTMQHVANAKPLWVDDMGPELDKQLGKCKEKFSTFWVEPYTDMWPEFVHHPDMVQLLPSGQRQKPRVSKERRAEPEDLLVENEWHGRRRAEESKHSSKRKHKKKKRKRRMADVANSNSDSDELFVPTTGSDSGEDAVPPQRVHDEEKHSASSVPVPSDAFGENYGDVDAANIRLDQPRQRHGRNGNA